MIATNSNTMKLHNQSLILDIVRRESCSRTQLSARTGLTKAAVSIIVDDLIQRGILLETAADPGAVGRPPLYLTLNRKALFFLGIDITRRGWSVGAVDLDGRVLGNRRFSDPVTPGEFSEKLPEVAGQVLSEAGIVPEQLFGVGITSPGPVNVARRTILNPPNFGPWKNFPLGASLASLFPCPVFLENISNAVALSEKYFGAAADCENFMTVLVNEGIGSGIVSEGNLFRGNNELGHTVAVPGGIPCNCGNVGCLECYASVPALLGGTPYRTWKEAARDPELIRRAAGYFGTAFLNACNLFRLEKIIFSGTVTESGDSLAAEVFRQIQGKTISDPPEILVGRVTDATLVSAAPAIHSLFSVFPQG